MTTTTTMAKIDDIIARQRRRGVDIRPTLLLTLTDVYVGATRLSPEDESQYAAIALRLIEEVDTATRREVARRLRACPRLPRFLADRLAFAAAPRTNRAPTVPERRSEAADIGAGRRFFAAEAAERRRILADLDGDAAPPPSGDAVGAVAGLEASALAGHPGEFIRGLERALRLPRETAERIVNDLGGEPMVVVARALGMPLPVLQRVLMFLNPAVGHSVRRVYDLSEFYAEVTPAAARRLVAAWRSTQAGERAPLSQPASRRDDDDGVRAAAMPRPFGRQRPFEASRPIVPVRRFQRTN